MLFNLTSEVGGQDMGERLPPSLVSGLDIMYLSNLTAGYFSGFQLLTQISFVCFFIIFIAQSELTV